MMEKKRKISGIFRRTTGLLLALLIGFGDISGNITVYASGGKVPVGDGESGTQDVSGGTSTNSFGRYGTYIAVTPVYSDGAVTTVEEVNLMSGGTDENPTIADSFYTEESVAQEEAALALPSQNQSTLLFVSHDIWQYYPSTLQSQYSKWRVWALSSNTKVSSITDSDMELRTLQKNIIMSGNGNYGSNISSAKANPKAYGEDGFVKTAYSGVFREAIKKYLGKDKSGYNVDFSSLTTADDKTKVADKLFKTITSNATDADIEKAYRVWNYITEIDWEGAGTTMSTEAGTRMYGYLSAGYNNDIRAEDPDCFDGWNTEDYGDTGLLLAYGSDDSSIRRKLFDASSGSNPNADYCNNLYNLGMLDLMFCAYIIAKNQGAKAADGWKEAILQYLKTPADTDPGIRISLQVGMIVHGKDKDGGTYYTVFASCNDLVDKSYGLDNLFAAVDSGDSSSTKAKDSTKSVNKPYSGYFGHDGISTAGQKWFAGTSLNKQNDVSSSNIADSQDRKDKNDQKTLKDNTTAMSTKDTATKKYTYQDYYTRLRAAVKAKGKDYAPGLTWYSWNSLSWVLGTAYKKDGSETAYTMASYIELLRARNIGRDETTGYDKYIGSSYGGGYYACHGWHAKTADYAIGARLEISSAYYNKHFNNKTTYWAGPDTDFKNYTEGTDYFKGSGTCFTKSGGKGSSADATIRVDYAKAREKWILWQKSGFYDASNFLKSIYILFILFTGA